MPGGVGSGCHSGSGQRLPQAAAVGQQHLLGLWRAEFEGLPQGATLLLEAHPEFAESVRGAINRNGERAWVAGDVEDGEFTLEESLNGTNINAVWVGDLVEGSCGREIRAHGRPRASRGSCSSCCASNKACVTVPG